VKISPDEALRLLCRALQPMEAARRLTEAIHDNACRVYCDGKVVKPHMAVDVRVVPRLEDDRRWTVTIESISRQWHGQSYRWEFQEGEVKALLRTPLPTTTSDRPAGDKPRQKPGTKTRDDWPVLVARKLIYMAHYDFDALKNADALVELMQKYLDDEIGWFPKDPKQMREMIVSLLQLVRR
jgi:hypothetical protein